MTTLNLLRKGQRGCIEDIDGEDTVSMRLMEMGVIEGEEIEFVGLAPLGDPLEFQLRGYRLSLRANEAKRVHIKLL